MSDKLAQCIEKLHETFESTDLDVEWKKMPDDTYQSF